MGPSGAHSPLGGRNGVQHWMKRHALRAQRLSGTCWTPFRPQAMRATRRRPSWPPAHFGAILEGTGCSAVHGARDPVLQGSPCAAPRPFLIMASTREMSSMSGVQAAARGTSQPCGHRAGSRARLHTGRWIVRGRLSPQTRRLGRGGRADESHELADAPDPQPRTTRAGLALSARHSYIR